MERDFDLPQSGHQGPVSLRIVPQQQATLIDSGRLFYSPGCSFMMNGFTFSSCWTCATWVWALPMSATGSR